MAADDITLRPVSFAPKEMTLSPLVIVILPSSISSGNVTGVGVLDIEYLELLAYALTFAFALITAVPALFLLITGVLSTSLHSPFLI